MIVHMTRRAAMTMTVMPDGDDGRDGVAEFVTEVAEMT